MFNLRNSVRPYLKTAVHILSNMWTA